MRIRIQRPPAFGRSCSPHGINVFLGMDAQQVSLSRHWGCDANQIHILESTQSRI
jgi:hypothetical protein